MPNLAKTETRLRSQPQRTFRRETTMPRGQTEAPDLQVNARIERPDTSAADELSRVLGLVNETGQKALKQIAARQDEKNDGQAVIDFATGKRDDARYGKSWAYYEAWQRESSKSLAIDISTDVTAAVNERLNDEDDPATLEDIDNVIEETFKAKLAGPDGKVMDFGTAEAKSILGNALREVRSQLIPGAQKVIKDRQDDKLLGTVVQTAVYEAYRGGAPIGAAPPPVDPLAPLPDADPLAPLPGPQDPPVARTVPRMAGLGKPTGRLPIPGAVTTSFAGHAKRGSAGLDIDGRKGDPIEAPAGGKVIKKGADAKSGNYVIIDHGNGVTSSYSHLANANVKEGDIVQPGQKFAFVGNSGRVRSSGGGDGSHLHYRVKVNGKDVDPATYRFRDGGSMAVPVVPDGEEVELADVATPEAPAPARFDFEGTMARVPASVPRGRAKSYILKAVLNAAAEKKDPRLLDGLIESTRADGTPSFNPDEQEAILATRERLTERNRVEADRLERETKEANGDAVLRAMLSDAPPSRAQLLSYVDAGKIEPEFAFSIIRQQEAEERQEVREQRAEERQAEAEAQFAIDQEVGSIIALRSTGVLTGASAADDQRRLDSGELGTGKRALARFRQLRAAARAGETELQRNPEVASFAGKLEQQFKPKPGNGSLLQKAQSAGSGTDFPAMMAHYKNKVREGVPAEEAYRSAIATYGPKKAQGTAEARQQRILELRNKRLTAGR